MNLQVRKSQPGILDLVQQLRVAPVQNPHLNVPSTPPSPLLPGLTADNPETIGAWAAHDFTSNGGLPMHMPAYSGRGRTPLPLARPLPMPNFSTFNKLRQL